MLQNLNIWKTKVSITFGRVGVDINGYVFLYFYFTFF